MDIERFEKILQDKADEHLELNTSDKSWQKFYNAENNNNSTKRILVYLSATMIIIVFSFIAGVVYSEYKNEKYGQKEKSVNVIVSENDESTSEKNNSKNADNTINYEKIGSNESINTKNLNLNTNNKIINNKSTISSINAKNVKPKINNSILTHSIADVLSKAKNEINLNEEIIENINIDKGYISQSVTQSGEKINNSDLKNYTTKQLDQLNLKINSNSNFNLELKIEPLKNRYSKHHQLHFGGLVFIKEHQQNYVGWRLGYYHQIKKNIRLFGSVYKVNDQVELETRIIPEHYPAPQPGLEIKNILINKSTYVIPFGVNYTYPKFKIKPSISLGFAPEYANINKVKYKYRNSSDNIPEETKLVNIKTSNFYLYSDIGLQGSIYKNIEWKLSSHILNYLSGHEDGADNEDNFKCYVNAGLIYKL